MSIQFPDEHYLLKAKLRGVNSTTPEAMAALAVLNRYEELMETTRSATDATLPKDSPVTQFERLTKRDAVTVIFQELQRPARVPELYRMMKARGHPIADTQSLRAMLADYREFSVIEIGLWKYTKMDDRGAKRAKTRRRKNKVCVLR